MENKDFKSNRFLETVEKTIVKHDMFHRGERVLAAVSGGPDSMAMLHVLIALIPRFSFSLGIAHLNHSLRGEDSDNDAAFVASRAERLGLQVYLAKENVKAYQKENRLSLEDAARQVRYNYLFNTAREHGYTKIALGHTRNDNAELVLMNLIRGSGKTGLAGIPPVRGQMIIRPILGVSRAEVIEFLDNNGLAYVSDRSNEDINFLRNRVRHELIPLLNKEYSPNIINTLDRTAAILREDDIWSEDTVRPLFEKMIINKSENKITLSVQDLKAVHPATGRRIVRMGIRSVKGDLRRITFSHVDSVISLMENKSPSGRLDLPDRIRAGIRGEALYFEKKDMPLRLSPDDEDWESPVFEYTVLPSGFTDETLFIKETGYTMRFLKAGDMSLDDIRGGGNDVAFIDMDRISFPLVIRNCRSGDRFTPLGMSGSQKVSRFFINKRIPKAQRVHCPVLISGDQIIWVAGYRIAEPVKVTPSTINIMKVELLLA